MMTNEISKNGNKKSIVLFIVVITLVVLLVAGGTYAFLSEDFGATNGNYAYNTACFDIVYDVTNEDGTSDITGTLIPSSSARGGLTGRVSIGLEEGCKTYAYGDIFLNISSASTILTQTVEDHCENIVTLESMSSYTTESYCTSQTNGIWVTDGTALKYAVYKDSKDKPISVGYINSSSQVIDIYKEFNVEEQIDYDIYIWLDGNLIDNSYTSLSFGGNISVSVTQVEKPLVYQEEILNGAGPVLDDGMIPVTIGNDGTVTTVDKNDKDWYNYGNKKWANAVVVGNDYRSTYKGTTGVEVNEDHILGYYVWIPRFKYQVWTTSTSSEGNEQEIQVIFEDADTSMSAGTAVGSYRTPPAFWWDDDSDGIVDSGETVAGIWVGKFETSANTDSTCYTSNSTNNCLPANVSPRIVPNVKSLRYQTVSNQFATSQKFSASGNPYGLSSTSTNAHMMKNSEWGAVAYLSHSAYGINGEIYINNSSGYYTGRSGGNVGGSVNGLATQFPDDQTATTQYNSYGYYTWTGQAISSTGTIGEKTDSTLGTYASTTGNITGVYDMSGGAFEYVMGNFGDTIGSAGFSTMPDSKNYDLYSSNQFTGTYSTNASLCTLATCGGHALYETNAWYGDYAYFVSSGYPWFARGGDYNFGASAGVFAFYDGNGNANSSRSWRSVLVIGFGE